MGSLQLGKSRLTNQSSHDGSSEGSSHGRRNLLPLQVDKSSRYNSWDGRSEQEKDVNAAAASEIVSRRPSRLTSQSERILATRMNELSQLESPLLRELAHRIGEKLQIETPRCFKTFKHPYAHLPVAERWEEIQGCNDWKGIISEDKFDPVLKGEIIRYGEFAQATYDAFDHDKSSYHYGTCKYMKDNLLEQVGLDNRGYTIKYFLYATTNVNLYPNFLARSRSGDAEGQKQNGNEHSMECAAEKTNLTGTPSTENSEAQSERGIIDNGPNEKCHCSENSKQCNWIGFVAICTSAEEIARLGRRDILVAWRGSVTEFDWIADLMDFMSPAGFADHVHPDVRVENGFLHLYTSKNEKSRYNQRKSARDQVADAIKHLVAMHKHEGKLSITVTGHSLGSALATLCAYDIAECGYNLLSPGKDEVSEDCNSEELGHVVHEDGHSRHPHLSALKNARSYLFGIHGEGENGKHHRRTKFSEVICGKDQKGNKFLKDRVPVTVYSFGGPRVGNRVFVERMEALRVAVLRVINIHDRVRKVPGRLIHHVPKTWDQAVPFTHTYKHVGVKLTLDNEKSEYLQKPALIFRPHCLEGYLHLVDSYQGPGKPYVKTYRDIALVNKSVDFLLPKYGIPPRWWQEKNKGLVMNEKREWKLPGRDERIPETPKTPIPEEEVWDRNVHAAQEKTKAAMSHKSSEPSSTNGGHTCQY